MCHRLLILAGLLVFVSSSLHAQESSLTVDKIMQDPDTWIGSWPRTVNWSEDGSTLYFWWNPGGAFPSDSLFKVSRDGGDAEQVTPDERRNLGPYFTGWHHQEHVYDASQNRKVYAQRGDLYLHDRSTGTTSRLTQTRGSESSPRFTPDGSSIVFSRDRNLFRLHLGTGALVQLTDIRSGREPREPRTDSQAEFLEAQQKELFEVIRQESQEDELREAAQERDTEASDPPPTFYLADLNPAWLRIDPSERFVTFVTEENADEKRTAGMDYVTDDGYAAERGARAKVGRPYSQPTLQIQDLERDTTYSIDLHQIEGAFDVPPYLAKEGATVDSAKTKRQLSVFGPFWNGDGSHAVLELRARDHKDRWIVRLDAETGGLAVLDRQHDAAWIAGPGISWFGGSGAGGWLPDGEHFWFQSEASGYSHLYTVNVSTGTKAQLTSGEFEVFGPQISRGRFSLVLYQHGGVAICPAPVHHADWRRHAREADLHAWAQRGLPESGRRAYGHFALIHDATT